jgi:glycogen phosphorylase/synthase
MNDEIKLVPDYIFEVSWEVCNKVGGIYTVLSSKSQILEDEFDNGLILIGPDVWKGSGENPEFIEDNTLFKTWKEHATDEGLRVKIGRWNINGKPIVILVDFTPFFQQKNEIFADFWMKFQLDSLTGQWDYIEPAMFGYAAGKVIECFYRYHLNYTDKIVAQFHEWMTGTGILYLKDNAPQVGTIFTTHATVIGRCIAGNGLPFYSRFESFDPEVVAEEFNVVSKNSLEKISALNADCFTTVSDITARECRKFLGKSPDIITRNGFEPSIVPGSALFEQKRAAARQKILDVAKALFGKTFPEDTLLLIKSGRYEFTNKGIDIFIDSLAKLNDEKKIKRNIIGLIFVPAHQTGAKKELIDRINHPESVHPGTREILTHKLQGAETDLILNRIKEKNLDLNVDDNIRIIFVPTYLDGADGIFDFTYYDLLIGFDLAIFPSYYEPWGYTPLESIAFHIPAVTTSVAGFGIAIQNIAGEKADGIFIVDRTDNNRDEVVEKIAGIISDFAGMSENEVRLLRDGAFRLSQNFEWEKLIFHYREAYQFALEKCRKREKLFRNKPQAEPLYPAGIVSKMEPQWRSIYIQMQLPSKLAALHKLSMNLWWSWNLDAIDLFENMNPSLWEDCHHNPVLFLQSLPYSLITALETDADFLAALQKTELQFDEYMAAVKDSSKPSVAYFCMEYGLNNYIRQYSGGLGILAGDYLKEASDHNLSITGIGLLYRNGFFHQRLSLHGEQFADPDRQEFSSLPLTTLNDDKGNPVMITIVFPGRTVFAKVWKMAVGRVSLYLFDTDISENSEEDREITAQLYGGDLENRLKQELLLGIGGIRALEALGIKPDIYHCNEGHAAFLGIERIHNLITNDNLSYYEALEVIRASTLFTTHTSVDAANDFFTEELLRAYLACHTTSFNISWEEIMALGRINHGADEKFSMTYFASRISQEINAVSKIHRTVSCRLLNILWKDFKPDELHIGYVTNGVHFSTWTAAPWQKLYRKTFISSNPTDLADRAGWDKINTVPDADIWEIRTSLKRKMTVKLKNKLSKDGEERHENPKKIYQVISNMNENALFIGFARRFVSYKRPDILLYDIERLSRIVNDAKRPVQILFAGKSHPNDGIGADLIRQVIEITKHKAFEGKIIFLEDYDMNLAKLMVQGVDLWLNAPDRLMEASGTSGMKATLNGVLNLSVLDGWWYEGYREKAGWALKAEPTYKRRDFQDELDAETFYSILENEVIPLFFDRGQDGLPVQWIKYIKTAIANIAPIYTMTRMITDYQQKYYNKMQDRTQTLRADNFALSKNIAAWKHKIISHWHDIEIISVETENDNGEHRTTGESFFARILINCPNIPISDIGIEIIFIDRENTDEIVLKKELSLVEITDGKAVFECSVSLIQSGAFDYSFRIFPKNSLLPHRLDFNLIKWV